MVKEEFIRISIWRARISWDDEDILDQTAIKKELFWLTPINCSVYTPINFALDLEDIEFPANTPPTGGGGNPEIEFAELMVSFLSDKAVIIALIAALTKILEKTIQMMVEKSNACEVTIELGERKVTLKGPIKNKEELLNALFPELRNSEVTPAPSKLIILDPNATLNIKPTPKVVYLDDEDFGLG